MISAEQVPARVKKLLSSFRLRLLFQKPVAETIPAAPVANSAAADPADGETDEFRMRQVQELARMVKRMEQSNGMMKVGDIYILPSVRLDSDKKET